MNRIPNNTSRIHHEDLLLPQAQVIRGNDGQELGVFLDMNSYRQLLEELEDARDLVLIKETLTDERIPWEQAKEELRRKGKL